MSLAKYNNQKMEKKTKIHVSGSCWIWDSIQLIYSKLITSVFEWKRRISIITSWQMIQYASKRKNIQYCHEYNWEVFSKYATRLEPVNEPSYVIPLSSITFTPWWWHQSTICSDTENNKFQLISKTSESIYNWINLT